VSSRLIGSPRVAVLLPVSTTWQTVVAGDIADDRSRLLLQATRAVAGRGVTVVESCLLASEQDGIGAAAEADAVDAEVVLVLATMAVLPSVSLAALEPLADRPIVVWALAQGDAVDFGTDLARIVLDGGTVGAPLLTSVLVRAGRAFELVLGPLEDGATLARVGRAIRAGAAARRISRARVGRVGQPLEGYGCVDLDTERLHDQIGTTVVPISPAELTAAYDRAADERVEAIVGEMLTDYVPDATLARPDIERSARSAAALETLVHDYDLDAGALNCHVAGVRYVPGLGFAPCFALGRMTSHGVPWSCSSDLPAVMAMLMLKALGHAAQYQEIEVLGDDGDFLLASSGEHDLAFAGELPRLVRNGWFPNDARPSVCACFIGRPGPATILGFAQLDTPRPAHRLVAAGGVLAAADCPRVGTAHALFRFAHGSPTSAWETWASSGVGLHSACTSGDVGRSIDLLGRFLEVEVVHV
jgi:L-arabinose isomerase